MHRSGTSAATASLAALGIATPSEVNPISASRWNERGNFESRALKDLNDRLLFSLGGTWSGPPDLKPGWETDHTLDSRRDQARRSLAKLLPTRPVVWKDPRNCLTLPFWRTVVSPPAAAVFIYRDPLEVARSLQAREDVTLTYGLALWDRYVRSASANLVGLPTMVADYARILQEPAAWMSDIAGYLGEIGVIVSPPRQPTAWLAAGLRHHNAPAESRPPLAKAQFEVLEALRNHDGPHPAWLAPELGPEPSWVDDVLALRLQADKLRNTLNQAEQLSRNSRIFRITRRMGGLRR